MDDLQLLKEINNLARENDPEAAKLVLEWLQCDLTDFGSRDMVNCKIQSYLEGHHDTKTIRPGKIRND